MFIVNAFLKKIDGVMVLGCHFGDCHYLNGNYNAEKRIVATQNLLSYTAVEKERLYLDWVSAAEGERFASLVNSFVDRIRSLGPIKITEDAEDMLLSVRDVLQGERFRHLTGVEYQVTEIGNVYGERISLEDYEKKLGQILFEEYIKARILRILKTDNLPVSQIAWKLKITPDIVFKCICSLQEKGDLSMMEIKNGYPIYTTKKF